MKITIFGAGLFGTALGNILEENGHVIEYYDPVKGDKKLTGPRPGDDELIAKFMSEPSVMSARPSLKEAERLATWRRPVEAVTPEAIDKLVNLYDQMESPDAKRLMHRNSASYRRLKETLADISRMRREQIGSGRKDDTPEFRTAMHKKFEKAADAARIYLADKAGNRGTEMGQERYEIALAALHVTNAGELDMVLGSHGEKQNEKKKVSLNELSEREGRTADEQRAHHRARKEHSAKLDMTAGKQ